MPSFDLKAFPISISQAICIFFFNFFLIAKWMAFFVIKKIFHYQEALRKSYPLVWSSESQIAPPWDPFFVQGKFLFIRAFQVALVVKNLPAMEETQEMWVWSWGRSPGGGHGNPCGKEPSERQTAPPWHSCFLILVNSYLLENAECLLNTELWKRKVACIGCMFCFPSAPYS